MKPVFGVVGDEAIERRMMKDCVETEGGYGLSSRYMGSELLL